MMVIENKFEIGQTVYIITDDEQKARLVSGIRVCPGCLIYYLSYSANVSEHYEFEISETVNEVLKVK